MKEGPSQATSSSMTMMTMTAGMTLSDGMVETGWSVWADFSRMIPQSRK
jgi:hypothetical protein